MGGGFGGEGDGVGTNKIMNTLGAARYRNIVVFRT